MNNLSNFFSKPLGEQKDIIQSLHWEQLKSVSEIAEILGTYNNKIRRWAAKNNFNLRDKSDAQKIALQTGRINHPTLGKQRTEDEKLKIGNTVANKWEQISDEERERRSKVAKENWDNRSQDDLDEMYEKATKARLATAKDGSKLEKYVVNALLKNGYKIEFHKEHALVNERVHLDIFIPSLKIAIEIDGPSHFLPIWGQEHLEKTQKTDSIKDGLLLGAGFCIIRIQQRKNISKSYVAKLVSDLLEKLNMIEIKFPEPGHRRIIIGENYGN